MLGVSFVSVCGWSGVRRDDGFGGGRGIWMY